MNVRNDWSLPEVLELFALPFMDLLFMAQQVHRLHHAPNTVQISTLLSIKTGACPEDCAYCPQSVRYDTGLEPEELMELDAVAARARAAKEAGATRFCMGAAYRSPKPKDLRKVIAMIREVKSLGLETCATLGMVSLPQAHELKAAGLDYYNHNLDSSPEYYERIITTRTFQDRLDTLQAVRDAGMNVCCGGIVGMGEAPQDRVGLLHTLATLPSHPDSVPINQLVRVAGTPLSDTAALDPFDFVRTIAVARILMPRAQAALSGRSGHRVGLLVRHAAGRRSAAIVAAACREIVRGRRALAAAVRQRRSDSQQLHVAVERSRCRVRGVPPRPEAPGVLELHDLGSRYAA